MTMIDSDRLQTLIDSAKARTEGEVVTHALSRDVDLPRVRRPARIPSAPRS